MSAQREHGRSDVSLVSLVARRPPRLRAKKFAAALAIIDVALRRFDVPFIATVTVGGAVMLMRGADGPMSAEADQVSAGGRPLPLCCPS